MIRLRRAYEIVRASARHFQDDDGTAMAGYIAYSSFLAIFPFLIFAASVASALLGEAQNQMAIDALFQALPAHVAQTLEPVLAGVLQDQGRGVLTVYILISIWLASNAIEAFRTAFDRAYNVEIPRRGIFRRLIAIGLVLIGAVIGVLLALSIIFGPLLIELGDRWLHVQITFSTAVLGYVGGIGLFVLFLYMLHRVLPSRPMRGEHIWPGILTSVVIWLLAALVFSIYIAISPVYASIYGALTGVMVTLIFLYLSGLAIIFGAEVNAVLNTADAVVLPI